MADEVLYHATDGRWAEGEDLLSLLHQSEQGWITDEEAQSMIGRWDGVPDERWGEYLLCGDGTMVSLTANLAEAREILQQFNGGRGVIVKVSATMLREDGLLRTNAEGYPAVNHRIPAEYILGTASESERQH